jgi:hypothetical protein
MCLSENAWPHTTPGEAYLIGPFNTQWNHDFFNNFCAFQKHALLSAISFHILTSGGRNKLAGIPKNLKIDCLFKGIQIGNRDTQKINLFVVFFLCKKRWRRKLSTTKITNQLSNTNCSISEHVMLQKHQELGKIARFWSSKCGRDLY